MTRDPNAPLQYITTPVRLEYDYSAGIAATRFLRGLAQKKILGARCGPGSPVLVPPRGADPRTSELAQEMVEVSDTGTVVTYSVIRVPSENIKFELPYVCISVLLDGILERQLRELSETDPASLTAARYEKFRRMGRLGQEFVEAPAP